MSSPSVVAKLTIPKGCSAAGNTRHYVDGQLARVTAELRIVQFGDDVGYYLLHIDASGEEITDTYHVTVKDAQEQAAHEYGVVADQWVSCEHAWVELETPEP